MKQVNLDVEWSVWNSVMESAWYSVYDSVEDSVVRNMHE